jgi:hypothetical protein
MHGKEITTSSLVLRALGGLAGAAVGSYAGINLLIPLCATGAAWWIGTTVLSDDRKAILPALSVQSGHTLWLVLALALPGTWRSVLPDLVLYLAGIVWLIRRPSPGPLYMLGAYQLLSIAINVKTILAFPIGSASHKALLVHISWRLLALDLMTRLFLVPRRRVPKTPVPEAMKRRDHGGAMHAAQAVRGFAAPAILTEDESCNVEIFRRLFASAISASLYEILHILSLTIVWENLAKHAAFSLRS